MVLYLSVSRSGNQSLKGAVKFFPLLELGMVNLKKAKKLFMMR